MKHWYYYGVRGSVFPVSKLEIANDLYGKKDMIQDLWICTE